MNNWTFGLKPHDNENYANIYITSGNVTYWEAINLYTRDSDYTYHKQSEAELRKLISQKLRELQSKAELWDTVNTIFEEELYEQESYEQTTI